MPIVSAKQKVRRERRSYAFAGSHTVSPGEGSKCTASLQDCRTSSAGERAQQLPTGQDRTGQEGAGATGLPLGSITGTSQITLKIKHFTFYFP